MIIINIYGTTKDSIYTIIGEMDSDNPTTPNTTKTKKKPVLSLTKRKTRNRSKSKKDSKPHGSKPVPIEDVLGVKPKTIDTVQYSEYDDHVETDING